MHGHVMYSHPAHGAYMPPSQTYIGLAQSQSFNDPLVSESEPIQPLNHYQPQNVAPFLYHVQQTSRPYGALPESRSQIQPRPLPTVSQSPVQFGFSRSQRPLPQVPPIVQPPFQSGRPLPRPYTPTAAYRQPQVETPHHAPPGPPVPPKPEPHASASTPPPVPHASRPVSSYTPPVQMPSTEPQQQSDSDELDNVTQQIQNFKMKRRRKDLSRDNSVNKDDSMSSQVPVIMVDDSETGSPSQVTPVPSIVVEQDAPPVPSFAFEGPDDATPNIVVNVAPPSPKPNKASSYVPKMIESEQTFTASMEEATPGKVTTRSLANDLTCAGCSLPIAGRILSAMKRRWHPDCFKCTTCDEILEHVAFYEWEGKPFCHLDYHEQFSMRCFHCKTPIVDETYVTLDDPTLGKRYYHELHFFCSECGDPFIDPKSLRKTQTDLHGAEDGATEAVAKPFLVHDGWPYCEKCNVNLHKPRCKGCDKPIEDDVIKAMDSQWHETCFVCDMCKVPIEEAFLVRKDKPHCHDCYRIALRTDVAEAM